MKTIKQFFVLTLYLIVLTLIGYLANHYYLLTNEKHKIAAKYYFLTFFVFTLFFLIFLKITELKNKNNIGFAFLISTIIQFIAGFVYFNFYLIQNTKEELYNFLYIFLYFLAIETFIGIKILNKNQ